MYSPTCLLLLSIVTIDRIVYLVAVTVETYVFVCFVDTVISKVLDEGTAHWPVEVLPVLRQRNQRKAAQLQVRSLPLSMFLHTKYLCVFHFFPVFPEWEYTFYCKCFLSIFFPYKMYFIILWPI